jgi:hypothetical protein
MICRPRRRSADYAAALGAQWARNKHATCRGCDCGHRVMPGIPESTAHLGWREGWIT